MKLGDLTVKTILTNEESEVLEKASGVKSLNSFTEREQFIINSLVRKNMVTKITHENICMVVAYEQSKNQTRT
jgi:hypothetical protein|tara:strand:- start:2355 stop:2573 length:219 start_codon:yes stop_codon:yes gene_type:complete